MTVATMWHIKLSQVSFVNGIYTLRGGRHVDSVADQIVKSIIDKIKKKGGKTSFTIKPFQVRSFHILFPITFVVQVKQHMWVFVNALIENPAFDAQTKEELITQAKSFGSKCELSEDFYKKAEKIGIIESCLQWVRAKQMVSDMWRVILRKNSSNRSRWTRSQARRRRV